MLFPHMKKLQPTIISIIDSLVVIFLQWWKVTKDIYSTTGQLKSTFTQVFLFYASLYFYSRTFIWQL